MDFMSDVPFSAVVWLFPAAIALHEAEEWNILGWYDRHFIDLPQKSNASIRAFLVFMSLLGFVWTAVAVLPGNLTVTAFLISLLAAVVLLNALQHVYWVVAFRDYAPGVVTSVLLLIPVITFIGLVALQQSLLPVWYEVLLFVLVVPGLIQTIRAGNRLTPPFRVTSRFGLFLARILRLE